MPHTYSGYLLMKLYNKIDKFIKILKMDLLVKSGVLQWM